MKIRNRKSAKRVLVADDDPDICKVVRVNLEAEGLDVDVARHGWEALSKARMTLPDLIVLDVGMPGPNGLEVLRHLRGNAATQHIPVVLLTARTSDDDIWAGWKAGAAYYLTKPFNPDDLVRFAHSLFDGDHAGTA